VGEVLVWGGSPSEPEGDEQQFAEKLHLDLREY